MQRTLLTGLLTCLAVAAAAKADVTLRYSYEVKPNPQLPPQVVEALTSQLKSMTEAGMRMQLKGNRAFASVMGITSISDFDGEMITLIDAKQGRYATAQKDAYLTALLKPQQDQFKQMSEQSKKAIEQVKFDVRSDMTDRKLSIQGVETEERKIIVTMGIPGAPGPMRMEFTIWAPNDQEINRNPMLSELRLFSQRAYQGTNPGAVTQKMFMQSPGMGPASKMLEVFKETPVVLRMRMAVFAPSGPAPNSAPGAPEVPMVEMIMSVEELSSTEVPDSIFRLPREYTVVSMDELMPAMYAQFAPAKPPRPPAP